MRPMAADHFTRGASPNLIQCVTSLRGRAVIASRAHRPQLAINIRIRAVAKLGAPFACPMEPAHPYGMAASGGRSVSCAAIGTLAGFGKSATDSLAAAVSASDMPLWLLGLRCVGSAAAAVTGGLAVSRILRQAADRQDAGDDMEWSANMTLDEEDEATDSIAMKGGFFKTAIDAFWVALHRPASLFIPVIAVAYSVKEIESWIRAIAMYQMKHSILSVLQRATVETILRAVSALDNLIIELDELVAIALGVWVLLRFKDRMVQVMVHKSLRAQAKSEANVLLDPTNKRERDTVTTIERVFLPLSGAASWLMVAAGALTALHVVGLNLQPLLAVGGVSGIIVGLSAQTIMANMLSGINLFLSQPFVVGERVKLLTSSGNTAFEGTIESIYPMRTVIRSDHDLPTVIPNQALSSMVIVNESRVSHSRVRSAYNKPRSLSLTFALRYEDFSRVEAVLQDMRTCLGNNPQIDTSLPWAVRLLNFDDQSLNINLRVHTTAAGSRSFSSVRTQVLLDMGNIISHHGASMAYPISVCPPASFDAFAGAGGVASASAGADVGSGTALDAE